MSFNKVMFCLGCAAAWFMILPLFVIGGLVALFTYAVACEVVETLLGADTPLGDSSAREIASRMCMTGRSLRTH